MKSAQKQRFIFIIIGIVIAFIALYLSIDAFKDKASLFKSPQELLELSPEERAKNTIRLGGLVQEDSIQKAPDGGIFFTITDLHSDISVYYKGLLPDLFREGQGVYVDGQFNDDGDVFIATELLAKHDENYTPPMPGEGI